MANPSRALSAQLESILETITNIEGQHWAISIEDAQNLIAVVDRLADVTKDIRSSLKARAEYDRGEFVDIDDVIGDMDRIIVGKDD